MVENILEAVDLYQDARRTEYKVDLSKDTIPFSIFTNLKFFNDKDKVVGEFSGYPSISYFTEPDDTLCIRIFLNKEQLMNMPKGHLRWELELVDIYRNPVGVEHGKIINSSRVSLKQKIKKKLDRTGKTARPWDILNPETKYVSEEVAKERLSTCEGCPFFTAAKTCEKCGCFMPLKTKLAHAECPVGKWHAEMI